MKNKYLVTVFLFITVIVVVKSTSVYAELARTTTTVIGTNPATASEIAGMSCCDVIDKYEDALVSSPLKPYLSNFWWNVVIVKCEPWLPDDPAPTPTSAGYRDLKSDCNSPYGADMEISEPDE